MGRRDTTQLRRSSRTHRTAHSRRPLDGAGPFDEPQLLRDIHRKFSGCDSAMKPFLRWISEYGERLLFSVLGLIFVGFSILGLWQRDITSASASFGLGFLSFIYANVARFKKFKGLGFEAELWEDKKKEAEHLIERLKAVVSIYTQEVVLSKVTAGRTGTSAGWRERWKLYDDLVQHHSTLGQEIDFTNLKKEIDSYFLFDMTMIQYSKVRNSLQDSYSQANSILKKRFGSPVSDIPGFSRELEKLRSIQLDIKDLLEIAKRDNLADRILNLIVEAKDGFQQHFGIPVDIDADVLDRLAQISMLFENRPVKVTDQLIAWTEKSPPEG